MNLQVGPAYNTQTIARSCGRAASFTNPDGLRAIVEFCLQEWGGGSGLEDRHRFSVHRGLREVSLPLQQGGHRGELIEGILSMPAVEIDEEKGLGAPMINLRNVQGSAERTSEALQNLHPERWIRRRPEWARYLISRYRESSRLPLKSP
jgi:hypothetical protein